MRIFSFPFAYIVFFAFVITVLSDKALSEEDDFSERIRKIENEIENSRKELEKGEKKLNNLKSREKKIVSELDLQEKNIENVHRNLRIIQNEEKSLRRDIKAAQKSYDDAMESFTSRSEIYAERLRSMYKRQKVSPLEILFTSGSMSSVLSGFKMLSILAAVDLEVLNDVRQQTRVIQASWNKLNAALNANFALSKSKENEQSSLANSRVKKRKLLDEIKRDEELQQEANRKQEEDLKQIRAQFDKIIRKREKDREKAKIKVPPSLEGYNFAEHKGKLPWPVNGKVVSRFGKVIDSSTKTQTNNRGIEIETKHGEPVSAIADGVVFMTQYFRGYGNFVLISHPSNPQDYYTIYGHLSDILVNNGDIVMGGDVIGLAGSTGMIDNNSSRLVLEILKGEKPENPLNWLSPDRQRAGR